jgi:tetratricopeptide (TPR) repeat protein
MNCRSIIFILATTCTGLLSQPVLAAMRGDEYISNDKYGRCMDDRLSPDIRIAECLKSFHGPKLTDYGAYAMLDGLGLAYMDESDYSDAITVFTDAVKTLGSPDHDFFRYRRGMAYLEWGKPDEATNEFTALAQDANSPYAYAGLASVATDQGNYADAIKFYNRALAINDSIYWIQSRRGAAYALMGDYGKAMADDNARVSNDPRSSFAYSNRCWDRAVSNRDLDGALEDCDHALDILPDDPDALDSRGLVHFRQGHLDDAIADYDAALSHNPKLASSLFMRGIVEIRKGDAAKGNADVQRAYAIYPRVGQQFAVFGIAP